jgi:hypothetical protein
MSLKLLNNGNFLNDFDIYNKHSNTLIISTVPFNYEQTKQNVSKPY